jgi:hypothetical protein
MALIPILWATHQLFSQTTVIKHLNLCSHIIQNPCSDNDNSNFTELLSLRKYFDFGFMNALRIVTSFENIFKVELINYGYVVHLIDCRNINNQRLKCKCKKLKEEQKIRPVKVSEIKALQGISWPRRGPLQINYLEKRTITISQIISENNRYKNSLHLTNSIIKALKDLNRQRNKLHLYFGACPELPMSQKHIDLYMYLIDNFNQKFFYRYNKSINRYNHLRSNPNWTLKKI